MTLLNEINPGQECRIIRVNIGGAPGQRHGHEFYTWDKGKGSA